jgi:hypothetical protein
MSIRRQNDLPGALAGRQEHRTGTPAERRRWRPRRRRAAERTGRTDAERTGRTPQADAETRTMAGAVQMAIGVLTASLDSHELEAWAVQALIPEDPTALGDFLAGLHVVSGLLLQELQEATGRPPAETLQELAILAETWRGTPSTG